MIVNCKECKKEFNISPSGIKPNGNYCSRKCRKNRVKTNCITCGKEFEIYPYLVLKTGNHCNSKCRVTKVKINCKVCGKEFKIRPECIREEGNRCSMKCRRNKVKINCKVCGKEFETVLSRILETGNYCSRKCTKTIVKINCKVCKKEFEIIPSNILEEGNCCSRKCFLKSPGASRSKLELWLEEKLINLYPSLDLTFNDREVCEGLELDIFIPSLNLAFEINGGWHYKVIKTKEILERIQKNDRRKKRICKTKEIILYTVKTPEAFSKKSSKKYLDYITNLIESHK